MMSISQASICTLPACCEKPLFIAVKSGSDRVNSKAGNSTGLTVPAYPAVLLRDRHSIKPHNKPLQTTRLACTKKPGI